MGGEGRGFVSFWLRGMGIDMGCEVDWISFSVLFSPASNESEMGMARDKVRGRSLKLRSTLDVGDMRPGEGGATERDDAAGEKCDMLVDAEF